MSDYFSSQWCRYTAAPAEASHGIGWLDFVHPDDVPTAQWAWDEAVATAEPYVVEYRLRGGDGSFRWMLARGLPVLDEDGNVVRWVGTCTDIDERVRTAEALELMSQELSHRIKNLFAMVQGLIAMALRPYPGMAEVSRTLQARMVALGRAHDLVRPRISGGIAWRSQTTLQELVRQLLAPHGEDGAARVEIVGPDIVVIEQATTPLALLFHEMTTNSAKFGALSCPEGRLRVAFTVGDDVVIDWEERGGPPIAGPPIPSFGMRLAETCVERQLGGQLTLDWQTDGLKARARFPVARLAGNPPGP